MSGAVSNIAGYLPRAAAERPHQPSVVCPSGRDASGRRRYVMLTNAQLDRESDRLARGLAAAGIERGMRTVLMVKPTLELFSLVFALFKLGAVPVMVDPGMGRKNLGRCLAEARPQAFIGISLAHALRALMGWGRATVEHNITVGRRWFWGGATLDRVRSLGGSEPEPVLVEPRAEELAAILFTSGGTGVPKGVEYQHGTFLAQVEAIRAMFSIQPGEVDLPTFPLFALFDPALGMTAVLPEMDFTRPASADPELIFEAIRDWGATNMFGSPALLDTVGRYGQAHGVRLPSLRRVMSAGAPVLAPVMERFLSMLGPEARVVTPYGATEALPVATLSSQEVLGETRHATDQGVGVCVGQPVPSIQLAIVPTSDEPIEVWNAELPLPVGQVGEIAVKGPQVTRAYFGRDQATVLAKIPDPSGGFWHRMGDLGYLDPPGRLWFCGRKAHRVVTPGGALYTIPCEAVFNRHAAVRRSALVGFTRGRSTAPALCVELEAGQPVDREALVQELLALGAEHEHTREIQEILVHPGFPVDVRHNAKIDRLALARWAQKRLRN